MKTKNFAPRNRIRTFAPVPQKKNSTKLTKNWNIFVSEGKPGYHFYQVVYQHAPGNLEEIDFKLIPSTDVGHSAASISEIFRRNEVKPGDYDVKKGYHMENSRLIQTRGNAYVASSLGTRVLENLLAMGAGT
ncbi:MAG: hypothetical protein RL557_432 [archaeon]|jgi:hypothetical protein